MKKKKLKNTITGKVLIGLLMTGVVLNILIASFIGIALYRVSSNSFEETIICDELVAAHTIKPDKLKKYILTGETDEYYYDYLDYLQYLSAQSGYLYTYVFYLEDGYQVFVFDSGEYGNGDGAPLGYLETSKDADASLKPYSSDYYEGDFWFYKSHYEDFGVLYSFFCPIYNDDGSIMAYIGIDAVPDSLVEIILRDEIIASIICIFMVSLAMIVYYYELKKRLVDPIETLKTEVKSIAERLDGEETVDLNIRTGDEIEDLSHVFEDMYAKIRAYMDDIAAAAAEKERIAAELSIATDIQASLLPSNFPDRSEFRICATMDPAKEVGGDFYDFFMVDDSHLAFVVADVSGKGIPAALFMVIAKTLIKDYTGKNGSLGDVFFNVNNILIENDDRGMFVTAFEGVLDLKTGEVIYVNAGHEPPFVRTKDGYKKIKPVAGLVLSCMPDIQYNVGTLQFSEGDAIFQYTDGVTEATDVNNELYGFDRLETFLNNNTDKTASELLSAVKADIDAFVGSAPQFDDITMLCLEFTQKMKDE